MNPSGQVSEAKEKTPASEMVEVVVETEAEAGASGYSVTGGGKKGIFVKEVLRDSPAEKHLSLQKGDQLLSAKVYFDNVKYEDALKILQCAEPYKVSFLLKRTVPGTDVSMHPRANVDLKGPRAKMPKMSVRSKKPFKAKKMRAGRFGLKRLKENSQTRARREMEMEMEMSPVKVDFRPVDVEFVFPKFRKSATVRKEPVEGGYGSSGGTITAERKKRKIRFPKMKVKQTVIGDVSKDVDTIGAKVKVKEKAPIFGMAFTKTKNTKADSLEACKELKSRDIKFRPPSVEFDFSMLSSQSDADLIKPQVKDKDMLKFKAPEVQLSLRSPSGKAEDSSALATRKKGKKGPKASIKEGVKAENGESLKIEIPKIGFGSVDKTELGKDKNGKTKKATLHLSVPELIQHSLGKKKREKTSGPEGMFGIHVPSIDKFGALRDDVEASLPKLALITPKESLKEKGKELDLGLSSIEISLPKTKCEPKLGVQGREPDGAFQIRAIKLPVVDISLQKPDTDTHLPKPKKIAEKEAKEKLSRGSQDRIDGLEFKMPKIPLLSDNQDSKVESTKDADGKLTMPQVGISLPGIKTEDVDKRVKETSKFKMPTLTKMKVSKKETDIECAEMKGVKLKLPKLNIAIPKHASQDIETEAEGITSKFKLPEFDFSLPNIKGTDVSTSETKEGKGHVPQIDISLPKVTSPAAKVNVKEHSDKLQMPKLEILLPTTKLPEEKTTAEYGGIKSIALNLPKIDLSLPKRKSQEIDAKVEQGSKLHIPEVEVLLQKQKPPQEKTSESPKLKDFRIPTLDVSAPKIKSEAEVAAASPRSKESKRHISHIDILLPIKKTLDTKVNVKDFKGKGGTLTLPRCDISLPKIHSQDSDTEADITLSKGLKRNMPSLNISLPNLTLSEESILVSRGKKDVTNSRAAPVKIPAVNIEIPKFDINLNLPIRKKDVPTEEKVIKMEWFAVKGKGPESPKPSSHGIKFGKGNLPDISLSTSKGKTEVGRYKVAPHIEPSKAKHDLKVDTNEKIGLNLPTLKMPKLNIVTPKLPDIDLNLKMPKGTNETSTDQTAADHRPEWSENVPGIAIKIPKMFISDKEKGTEMKSPEADSEIPAFGSLKRAIKLNLESVFSKEKVDGREETNILKTSGRPRSDGVFLEIPKLSLPKLGDKFKSEDTEEQRAKRGTLMKVPFIEKGEMVKAKKGKFDIAKTENAEESDDDQMKYKLKIPKLSMPKLGSKDTDTGGSHVDPEHKIKVKMPSIEISLPAAKVPEGERLLPKAEAEVSEADIKRHEGNVKIPTVCISAPKISLGVSIPKDKHGVSTESGVRKEDESDQGFQGIASKLGIPKVTLPSFNVSSSKEENTERDLLMRGAKVNVLTHGSAADVSTDRQETKLKIPKIKKHQMDITEDLKNCKPEEEGKSSFTLPKFSVPDLELKVEKPKHGGEITVTDHSGNKTAGDPMKFEIPAIDLLFSKGDVKLDASLPKGEVMKGRKPKSGTLNLKTGEDAQQESSLGEKFQMPKIAFPGVDFSIPKERADKTVAKLDSPEISAKSSKLKIPDLEISGPKGAVAEANDTERGVGKLQMPKVKLSDTPSVSSDPETASDGPRMPNVKKAVFVLFNPKSQKSHSFTSHSEKMTSKEQTEAKVHLPKTRMKQSFEKSCSKEKDVPKNELENETHGNFMSRGSKLKMPKLSFTQGKTGSSDIGLTKPWLSESRKDSKRQYGITDEKHSTSQNESQEAKIRFGKLTLPKIAFYSPYSKSSLGKEDTENTNLVKKGKSIWG